MATQIKRDSTPGTDSTPSDQPEVMSWRGGMSLVALFFVGFLLVIGLNRVFSNLVDELGAKSANERARLFIGEEVTRSINSIEMDVYRMATTIGVMAQARIENQLRGSVDKLERDLLVLKEGGTVQQVIHLNVEGMDEMLREVDFTPDAGDQRYVMELIELRPHLDQIKDKAHQLRSMLEQREGYRDRQDQDGLLMAEKEIKSFLKRIPSFFFRLDENANRLYFESHRRLQELEAQLAAQRDRYKTTEMVLSLLVILSVMMIGILFVRQINQSNQKLVRAWNEMRAAKDEAEQASRAKSEFVSRMSHELRTPLNAILGFAQLLDREQLTLTQGGYIQEINKAGNHLLELIDQVLDLAKIEAGRLVLEHIPFDLRRTVDEVVSIITGRARSKGLEINVFVSPALPDSIKGDPIRLRQILINLMGNALKFTERGGIDVRVEPGEEGARIRFQVSDTGIGMDEETIQRLFQPFTQADESTTRKYGGSGLGLRISKELVEAMGGTIHVESVPGQGSCFGFLLPLDRADDVPVAGETATAVQAARGGEPEHDAVVDEPKPGQQYRGHVLVVEDNPVNQMVASAMLDVLGISCDIANNGMEALEKLQQQHYGIVFMDVEMPVMDGYTATREIRLRERQAGKGHIPVIAMTANALNEDRTHCLANGMDEHLPKPVRMPALIDVIQRWLPLSATV